MAQTLQNPSDSIRFDHASDRCRCPPPSPDVMFSPSSTITILFCSSARRTTVNCDTESYLKIISITATITHQTSTSPALARRACSDERFRLFSLLLMFDMYYRPINNHNLQEHRLIFFHSAAVHERKNYAEAFCGTVNRYLLCMAGLAMTHHERPTMTRSLNVNRPDLFC